MKGYSLLLPAVTNPSRPGMPTQELSVWKGEGGEGSNSEDAAIATLSPRSIVCLKTSLGIQRGQWLVQTGKYAEDAKDVMKTDLANVQVHARPRLSNSSLRWCSPFVASAV